MVCGKPVEQIQREVAEEYLSKTVTIGETPTVTEAWKRAFLDGMSAGTILLMPGGVSQAPACHGRVYYIAYDYYDPLPEKIPFE